MIIDKIRVLLIDDEPLGLTRAKHVDGQTFYPPALGPEAGRPQGIPEIEELFELRWLATVEESREFRDLSSLVAVKQPQLLGEDGWVPEILCFDYQMTRGEGPVAKNFPEPLASQISPLQDLRELAERQGIRRPVVTDPPQELRGGKDSFGCYCGGLIYTLFEDYPCAPVALTRHSNVTAGTDAAFFEWFLELDGGDAFKSKSKPILSWTALLEEGVERLRGRIVDLIRRNLIDIDLKVLMALATGEEAEGLLIHSRFGSRHLPIRGIFCDIAEPLRLEMASHWAQRCLETLFAGVRDPMSKTVGRSEPSNKAVDEFREAEDFCSDLWEEYLSDRTTRRYRLSELVHRFKQKEMQEGDEAELEELSQEFGVDLSKLGGRQDPSCSRFHELRSRRGASQRMLRWTALLMAIRLELWAASCREAWRRHHLERGVDGVFDLAITPIRANDIYLALFPVPKNPLVTGFHDGKSITSSWSRFLKPKGVNAETSLALDLKELLDGAIWTGSDLDVGCAPCGLLPGEAQVLRWFAQSESRFRDAFVAEIPWLKGR